MMSKHEPPQSADEVMSRYRSGERYFGYSELEEPVCDFRSVDLSEADFSHSFLVADFRDASLRSANFFHCNIKTCDFRGADLRDAIFREAALGSTDFADANLTGADFEGARKNHAMNGTATRRRRHKAPLRGARKQSVPS